MNKFQKRKNSIEMIDVTFSYGEDTVLEDVNFSIKGGDYVAVVGPNGAAKSTLLKIAVGLLVPKKGKVKLFGEGVKGFNGWENVGYMAQQALDVNMSFPATVKEVVSSGYYSGLGLFKKKQKDKAVKKVIETVGIQDISSQLIGNLSGGQRQKVFLAKAIVKRPKILFLDEPTSGVDISYQEEFYRLLRKLNKENITIVMVTHDIHTAFAEANTIVCVNNKKVSTYDAKDKAARKEVTSALGYMQNLKLGSDNYGII